MKVIRKIKPNINRSSDGVKGRRRHGTSATVARASAGAVFHPNSIRGVINKDTPRTASLVLLPSLAVLAMFLVSFVAAPNNVYADDDDGVSHPGSLCPPGEDCSDPDPGTDTTTEPSATSSPTLTIEDAKNIGIKLSSEAIVLDISPTSSGVFKSESFTVDVSTNNSAGYNLTMTASGTSLSRTTPVNGTTPTIPTIPTGKTFTETTFETGYWGYKLGTETNYLPMTTEVIPINTTEEAANSSVNTITFASKLDNSIPSGTYSGITLSFIATTNTPPITYMQDMSTTKLASQCPSGVNTTVYDARDGKEYTVTQLDGVCIMTKNLQYIGGNNGTVSAGNGINSAGNAFTMTASRDGGGVNDASYATADSVSYESTPSSNNYIDEYGVYYNYVAASGGTITGSAVNKTLAVVSVCPKGWALPASDTTNNTWGGISGDTLKNSGYFDVFAGELDSSVRSNEYEGYWWSSTWDTNYYGDDLRGIFTNGKNGTFRIQDCWICSGGRNENSHTVRCILSE